MPERLQWLRSGNTRADDAVRRVLRRWVPEYAPYNSPQAFPRCGENGTRSMLR